MEIYSILNIYSNKNKLLIIIIRCQNSQFSRVNKENYIERLI